MFAVALSLCFSPLSIEEVPHHQPEPTPRLSGIYATLSRDKGDRYVGAAVVTWAGNGRYIVQWAVTTDKGSGIGHGAAHGLGLRYGDVLSVLWKMDGADCMTVYVRDGTVLRGSWARLAGGPPQPEVMTWRGRIPDEH